MSMFDVEAKLEGVSSNVQQMQQKVDSIARDQSVILAKLREVIQNQTEIKALLEKQRELPDSNSTNTP